MITHKKDTCCDEIGLHAQNIRTILGTIVDTIEKAYVITLGERALSL